VVSQDLCLLMPAVCHFGVIFCIYFWMRFARSLIVVDGSDDILR